MKGNIEEEVNAIKNQQGKDIWLYGGATLTSSLINLGLVDEMALAVHPVLLGAGKPLFQHLPQRIKLKLISSKEYPSGLVMLSYQFLKNT
ncbi:MAG: dihydrofolate reductase family protein [Chitinophagaceae bacterium]